MKDKFVIAEELSQIREVIKNRTHEISVAVHETLVQKGEAPAFISIQKLKSIYGRKTVENWIEWKLIDPIRDGENTSKYRVNVSEVILIAGTPHRCEYFNNKKA